MPKISLFVFLLELGAFLGFPESGGEVISPGVQYMSLSNFTENYLDLSFV